MKIADIISFLESQAHPSLQEHYDNAGLLTGDPGWECKGIICSLDATEDVVKEAIQKKCNLIVAHHPIIFGGLKKINGKNYVEKTIIAAIKNDIAIYAIHTNLDNIIDGVSGRMAKERTPAPCSRTRKSGKRVSVSRSVTINGCWVCQTQPDGLPSTGYSVPTDLSLCTRVSST